MIKHNIDNKVIFSCEVFPPKRNDDIYEIYKTLDEIKLLKPDFISVTYGAGGSNSKKTATIAAYIQNICEVEALAHMTAVGMDEGTLKALLFELKKKGVNNILALRGDRPKTMTQEEFDNRVYKYASDLIPEIKKDKDMFIAGACYPEIHPESGNQHEDIAHLREKVDAGCDFLTTQIGTASTLLRVVLVGPSVVNGHFRVHFRQFLNNGMGRIPGGLEGDLIAAVVVAWIVGIPLGVPSIRAATPIVPCSSAVLELVVHSGLAHFQQFFGTGILGAPGDLLFAHTVIEGHKAIGLPHLSQHCMECFQFHLFLAEMMDIGIQGCQVQTDSVNGPAATFNIQRFRHRGNLIEVNGTRTGDLRLVRTFVITDGRQDLIQPFLGAIELQTVDYMIRHWLPP